MSLKKTIEKAKNTVWNAFKEFQTTVTLETNGLAGAYDFENRSSTDKGNIRLKDLTGFLLDNTEKKTYSEGGSVLADKILLLKFEDVGSDFKVGNETRVKEGSNVYEVGSVSVDVGKMLYTMNLRKLARVSS